MAYTADSARFSLGNLVILELESSTSLTEHPCPLQMQVVLPVFLVFLYSNFIPKPHFYSIVKSWLNLQTKKVLKQ